ncbi:MAG: type I glyceraldehyde-3-phosphate dehydrogenase [Oscillospiraceae bacterium]|nr:type I glyceraldehyde-3-phosphate dehydrogenase [Oscillospiraceae bacterium]
MGNIKIGINGMGRIGRMVFRTALHHHPDIEIAAVNATCGTEYLAYQLTYDSVHGKIDAEIGFDENNIILNGQKIPVMSDHDPANLDWGKYGAEYVAECTGKFLSREKSAPHLASGAKKVIISAPAKDDTPTFVTGVNLDTYRSDMDIVSNASCTTNCLAPLAKVIHDSFGIECGLMTTIHAVTGSQSTVDGTSKRDWRIGRAASGNIIPTSTGAAKAVGKVLPALNGRLTGLAMRVPALDVSQVDLTVNLQRAASFADICAALRAAAEGEMKGILSYSELPLVSSDFISSIYTCVFDASASIELNDHFVKLIAWYDNEYGYSDKLLCLIEHMYRVDHG